MNGFIFDLDGVIVDTAKYHYLAWKNLANSIDIEFTELQNEELKGVSRVKSLEKILAWGNKTISETEFEALMKKKNEEYLNYISTMTSSEILPGVQAFLETIKEANKPIALGSASKNARYILDRVELRPYFDAIVDGNDVSTAKPNPEVFIKAAQTINCQAKECVVFEDSVSGIQAANTAQMYAVGIGEQHILFEAQIVFNDFKSMPSNFITELIKK
ncbi:beta-phosphoglucomutase [Aurantibacter aestuarii]|uniref:Beta-phosphoglucomutase n=1 Tax=Aurantibacter aestuarii TaxID=1266046 RepID=A0A2T1NDX9_9FLAO|nr:beta-phosphoglucomutase [Aurantibacter aestuarii]PSG90655.1 beta-phosphoglucomutase [Aurantibacter aestuarii]